MSGTLPRVAVFALIVWAPLPVCAGEIDTEHLFGFTIGTDIGEVGEKELEGQTTGRFGKRDGSYTGLSQMLSAEYTPMQNFRLEFSATGIYHDISWEIMLHIGSEQCGGPVLAAAVHGHVLIGLDGTKGIKTTSSVVGETFP